jgi:topoisomerase-4 subunit B
MAEDLFANAVDNTPSTLPDSDDYNASDIEVLEGLEPVRRRPGMYIGGADETAMHHLVSEVFDNSMDEAVAGFATRIELDLAADGTVTVRDNGRGIPVDPHPKYPDKSALEVILTTLHSGGKFDGKVYETSGGLHGVGISVVNALSELVTIEVVKNKRLYMQKYSKGHAITELEDLGPMTNRKGTTISFKADLSIFGDKARFRPGKLYKFAKSKAYLFKGVEVRWSCDPVLLDGRNDVPEKETIHFPNGIEDFLKVSLDKKPTITADPFVGEAFLADKMGRVEWAIHWTNAIDGFANSFCNTVPTPQGGTHENGFRAAVLKGVKDYGEMVGVKKVAQVTADDLMGQACQIISLFYKEPEFQGQTKDRLNSPKAAKYVENAVRDHFDNWLTGNPEAANALVEFVVVRSEERINKRKLKDVSRKNIVQKLRLPGKLTDCTQEAAEGTEIFLVEGDSAGGSAKMGRERKTQAILPLRGKILNVASATNEKINANQEIKDMQLAFGCGTGSHYREEDLRYERIIIMTDADVDGAHISALLMTYFYKEMPTLIRNGHLYLAQPPLFRIKQGATSYYAMTVEERNEIIASLPKNKGAIDTGRFKGLGEMTPAQLKETTMNPRTRILLKVEIASGEERAEERVEHLMGKNPEHRFNFIQEQSELFKDTLADTLDV